MINKFFKESIRLLELSDSCEDKSDVMKAACGNLKLVIFRTLFARCVYRPIIILLT